MPPPRAPHDPFNDAPPQRPTSRLRQHLRDTSSLDATNPSLRSAPHHQAPSTSTRRNLFASTLSRRTGAPAAGSSSSSVMPSLASSSNARLRSGSDVLEDSDDSDGAGQRLRTRRGGLGHNGAGLVRGELGFEDEEVGAARAAAAMAARLDVVRRDDKGGFIAVVPMLGEQVIGIEEERREEDARLSGIVRDFWASGAGITGSGSRGSSSRRLDEDDYEKPKADAMARLREAVAEKLGDEKWMFEATDYMESLRIANHGRL